jgi:hypothetical protein
VAAWKDTPGLGWSQQMELIQVLPDSFRRIAVDGHRFWEPVSMAPGPRAGPAGPNLMAIFGGERGQHMILMKWERRTSP